MPFLHIDSEGFLCLSAQVTSSKQYAINAGGQVWNQTDHLMIVVHKWVIKEIAWKDLWNTMLLVRLVPNRIKEINDNTDMSEWFIDAMYSVLERYSWYDEIKNISYQYIPKLSGEKLREKLDALDLFSQWGGTTLVDEKKGRFMVHKNKSDDDKNEYILAEFFTLCFLFGKATIQNDILKSYKVQVPVFHYDIQEKIEEIIMRMRWYGFVINLVNNNKQQVIDITTNDYMLLAYLRILLGEDSSVILIDKVLEIQQEIFIQYGISPEQKNMRRQLYEIKR